MEIYLKNFSTYFLYFFTATILLYILEKTAKITGLIDIPNNRSSHRKPTPCGGGIAIVLIITIFNLDIFYKCPAFFIGGFLLALISLFDDLKPLPVWPRLLTQMAVVSAMVILLPQNNTIIGIPMFFIKIILFFAGVWFINIYNFMDGIDGLAGGYANAAAVGFLFCIKDTIIVEDWNIEIYTQIVYITLPFIIFNWSPAKIFMGDTGSTFLGFTFFSLGVRGLIYGNYIMYAFIIIMSFFWIDATITLTRRFLKGSKVLTAHKEHAFQKAASVFGHWKVSLFIIFVTIFWLNPMAKYAISHIEVARIMTIISVLPVLGIILIFKPGLSQENEGIILKFLINRFKK
jgi:Fuc2NAc and GlcNAc transferase